MIYEIEEQIDVISLGEERSFLPNFCIVIAELIVLVLSSKLVQGLCLFFFGQISFFASLSTTSDSVLVVGVSLLSLVFTFDVSFLINDCFSSLELDLDLVFSSVLSLHPWVGKNFFEFGSVRWVECHHLLEEVFELSGVDVISFLCVLVSLPEDLSTVGGQEAVMWI